MVVLSSDVLMRRFYEKKYSSRISWSKNGFIAYPAQGDDRSQKLFLTYLECIDGRTWQLAPAKQFDVFSSSEEQPSQTPTAGGVVAVTSNSTKNTEITLVSWGPIATDLAVSDSAGNMVILVSGVRKNDLTQFGVQHPFTMSSLNELEIVYTDFPSKKLQPDVTASTQNEVIGFKWLNSDKPIIANTPAVRVETTHDTPVSSGAAAPLGAAHNDSAGHAYSYGVHQYKPHGAMHPLPSKQACVGVRKNGEFCLWHQGEHGLDYHRVSTFLDPHETDYFSLCEIGLQRDGSIVVVGFSPLSQCIRIYSVSIQWGYFVNAAIQQQKNQAYNTPDDQKVPPKLAVKRLFKRNISTVFPHKLVPGSKSSTENLGIDLQQLVHIYLVPPSFNSNTELEVFLGFENISSSKSHSTLLRFQLTEKEASNLHSAFITMGERRGVVPPAPMSANGLETKKSGSFSASSPTGSEAKTFDLVYKQSLRFNESILGFTSLNLDMLIAITFANGEVKMFNRSPLKQINNMYADPKLQSSNTALLPSSISSLFDAGFEFPKLDFRPRAMCISPNLCCFVALSRSSNKLYLECLEGKAFNADTKPRPGLLLSIAASCALRHSSACFTSTSTEDLVATIQQELVRAAKSVSKEYSQALLVSILQESHRAINFSLDFSKEQVDRLLGSPPLQRLLNLQLALGTTFDWQRTKSGKVAWALLNLRLCAFGMMITLRSVYHHMNKLSKRGSSVDLYNDAKWRSENVLSSLGVIRWCMDYILYLNQQIVELCQVFKDVDQTPTSPDPLEALKSYVALPLILGKVPRSLLLYSMATMKRLNDFVQKCIEKIESSNGAPSVGVSANSIKSVEDALFFAPTTSTQANKNNKSFAIDPLNTPTALPTVEAFYRLREILNNSPVPLDGFEKFLTEADTALRNLRIDKSTSLAIEQQLVCQGHVPKPFVEPIKKLLSVYSQSLLNEVDHVELYFYNFDWLMLDSPDQTTISTEDPVVLSITNETLANEGYATLFKPISPSGDMVDSLRKTICYPPGDPNITSAPVVERKCVRCGAVSSLMETTHLSNVGISLWSLAFQRNCLCGSFWVNI
ncbi:unnamed protein product [Kuraishia capsulata CBS 1993]|uniref:Mediator of RNA polymerase II transcription subunit 16 n=1 Tax=Kuraishia capsulata CBS 1993 TaxID=1382522 RepID=W6MWV2_9ASCO|nr:uncharacterized protein KUCA_T00003890001 [Kuraishia capsulata CBS 1993]CDK27910.1 unnamed protein product [Kuraishia capsulata CBS 1993]